MSPPARRAFSLVEILVVIAIISLLAAVLFPAFSRARETARRTGCANNLRQIGFGLRQYTQDFNFYPPVYQNVAGNTDPAADANGQARRYAWGVSLQPYIRSSAVFRCPSNPNNTISATAPNAAQPLDLPISYAANWNADGKGVFPAPDGSMRVRELSVRFPDQVIAVAETLAASPAMDMKDSFLIGKLFAGHTGRSNYLFMDGHVSALAPLQTYQNGSQVKNLWHRDHSPFN